MKGVIATTSHTLRARRPATTHAFARVILVAAAGILVTAGCGSDKAAETASERIADSTELIRQANPSWPESAQKSAGAAQDDVDLPEVGSIPNPVNGGGLTVRVKSAAVSLVNEFEAALRVTMDVTNGTAGPIEKPWLGAWCGYPDSPLTNAYDQSPPVSIPRGTTVEITSDLWLMPRPLRDCAPVVWVDTPVQDPTEFTVGDPSGVGPKLLLPVDLADLLEKAAPLSEDLPSYAAACVRFQEALASEISTLERHDFVPCAWTDGDGDAVRLSFTVRGVLPDDEVGDDRADAADYQADSVIPDATMLVQDSGVRLTVLRSSYAAAVYVANRFAEDTGQDPQDLARNLARSSGLAE